METTRCLKTGELSVCPNNFPQKAVCVDLTRCDSSRPVIRATTCRLSNPMDPCVDCRKTGHKIRRVKRLDADTKP